MKKLVIPYLALILIGCSVTGFSRIYAAYPDIPATAIGYASAAISYQPGPGVSEPQNDTSRALGVADQHTTSLGRGGNLILSTGEMSLKADGTDAADFYVYEHQEIEPWDTYVSTDNVNWTKIDAVSTNSNSVGSVNGYDLDSLGDNSGRKIAIENYSKAAIEHKSCYDPQCSEARY